MQEGEGIKSIYGLIAFGREWTGGSAQRIGPGGDTVTA
jgi:hypothetical protein